MKVLLVSANRERLPQPVVPLGVLSVAGSLRAAHDVAVCDLCFEDDAGAALATAIEREAPDVVGLGIRNLHTNAYDGTEELIAYYRGLCDVVRARTRAPLVLGGAGFSLRPETLLATLGADAGVVGEGERGMTALLADLAAGRMPRLVHGAAALAPAARVILRTSGGPGLSELDLLPEPARDLVDPRYYATDGTEVIQTKRGCAFSCSYCDYPDLEGRKVRLRDPARVADEVLARSRVPNVSHVFFVDSVFNVPRSHALALCDELVKRGTPLPWVAYVSPVGLDDELVSAMARAGCVGAEIGTDTGTDASLARLRKPFTLDDVRRTRAAFVRHGIHDCHSFVLGAEGETVDDARATLRFVEELDPDLAVFLAFMEDRESMTVHRAHHREEILALLADVAPKRPGWIVPELGIRFGPKIGRIVARAGLRGPSWIHLAKNRRAALRGSRRYASEPSPAGVAAASPPTTRLASPFSTTISQRQRNSR